MTADRTIIITDAPGGQFRWIVEDKCWGDGESVVTIISHETWPHPAIAEADARQWHLVQELRHGWASAPIWADETEGERVS